MLVASRLFALGLRYSFRRMLIAPPRKLAFDPPGRFAGMVVIPCDGES
jgi:hypothetical protein